MIALQLLFSAIVAFAFWGLVIVSLTAWRDRLHDETETWGDH